MAYMPPRMYDVAELQRRADACGYPRTVLMDVTEILAHLDRGGRACDSCGWMEPLRHKGRFHRCPAKSPQVYGRPYFRPRRMRGYYRVWDSFDRNDSKYDRRFRSLRGATRFLRQLVKNGVSLPSIVRYAKAQGILWTTNKWWDLDPDGKLQTHRLNR